MIAYLRLGGDSPRRDIAHPKFTVGSQVRITNVPADAHSRLPGYLRERVGTVERVFEGDYGYFTHTGDGIGDPMPIYIVEFDPAAIWGPARRGRPTEALRRVVRSLFGTDRGESMTGQFAYPPDREEISAKQVAALEALLIEKGVITPQTVDKVLAYFETEMTPLNGKKIVVKAWTDPEFAAKVVVDTPPAAVAELDLPEGMAGAEGEHLQAVANTAGVHNLVICTLCSCFPWPVLGLPPYWYKDPTFRSRPPANRARCSPRWAWSYPPTLRSRCGTPAATPGGLSFPNVPRGGPKISPTRC